MLCHRQTFRKRSFILHKVKPTFDIYEVMNSRPIGRSMQRSLRETGIEIGGFVKKITITISIEIHYFKKIYKLSESGVIVSFIGCRIFQQWPWSQHINHLYRMAFLAYDIKWRLVWEPTSNFYFYFFILSLRGKTRIYFYMCSVLSPK